MTMGYPGFGPAPVACAYADPYRMRRELGAEPPKTEPQDGAGEKPEKPDAPKSEDA